MPSGSETHQMFERSVCFPVSSVWMVVTCANRYYLTVSPGPPSCHWLLTQQTPLIRLFTLFPCSSFSVLLPPLMADVIFAHAALKAFVFLVRRHFGLKLWNQSCFFFFLFFFMPSRPKNISLQQSFEAGPSLDQFVKVLTTWMSAIWNEPPESWGYR